MELIDIIPEFNLYEEYWKIYTKSDIIPPQYVSEDADVYKRQQVVYHDTMENFSEISKLSVGTALIIKGTLLGFRCSNQGAFYNQGGSNAQFGYF